VTVFDGVSRGAVTAGRATRNELREVGAQARRTEGDLGKLTRGGLAGTGMFHGLGRSIAFASAGFLGGYGLTAAIGGAVKELQNSVRVSAQTRQALRSTGDVAGISAKQIDELAKSIMRKTGADNEAIKTSANLLLTFTQVRNEAGRGNDIFNQSVKAVSDMSAVIGDLSSNSITLGKALNDPVAGMTALRRVGVSFTAQQREQIKALMEHGHILQAQKIILAEVRREFGGQAAAQEKATGGLNTLRESIKNTSADLLRALLPSFRDLIASLQKQVDWLQNTREGQAKLRAVAKTLKEGFDGIVQAVKFMIAGFKILNGITGGFKNTMMLLIGLKVASVLAGWTSGFRKLAIAEALAVGSEKGAGARGLFSSLSLLKGLGRIVVEVIIVEEIVKKITGGSWFQDSVAGDVTAGGGNPYPKGTSLADLWELGHTGKKSGPKGTHLSASEQKAYDAGVKSTNVGNKGARSQANAIVAVAQTQIGIPYTWGGPAILGHSTDCSGLTQAVLAKNGVHVGRTTYEQWKQGRPVDPKHLQPGDLVFFNMGSKGPEHVGIYIGNGLFIEDPHTGASVRTSKLAGRRDFVGARRYIKNVLGGATAPEQQPDFTPHDEASLSTPTKKKTGGSKGATPSTLISVRAGIDAQLALFKGLTPAIRAQLSPLGLEAEKQLENLRAHLRKGMSATDLAKTRAGIARWGKVLRDEIGKAKTAAEKVAKEAADAAALAFDRQFRDASTGVFRLFDKETDDHVKAFQRDTEKAIAGMRKAFDRQMQAFDAQTQRGLAAFVVPTTPAEQALADFQASRQAEADAKAMADAQASGDPEQIRQLQLDLQERSLDAAAKQSRDAQDKATDAQQQAYQKQRDDQRNALQDQETDREQAYQDQRDATLAVYQQNRDDQRTHLQDDLDDWNTWITDKKKTWADFLKWLAGRGFAIPSSWFQGIDDEVIQRKIFGISAGDAARMPTNRGAPAGFALGGRVPGMFVGREDTVLARVSPGEEVIDRGLSQDLRAAFASGGLGGGTMIVFKDARFLGTTSREVERELASIVGPELDRRISYRTS
jgi:cell wall-associated NlpC family hydrolase